jgi:hypothetical protein
MRGEDDVKLSYEDTVSAAAAIAVIELICDAVHAPDEWRRGFPTAKGWRTLDAEVKANNGRMRPETIARAATLVRGHFQGMMPDRSKEDVNEVVYASAVHALINYASAIRNEWEES